MPGKDDPSQPCPDAKLTDAVLISIKGGLRKAVQKRKDAIAHWVADSNRHTDDTAGIQPWQLIPDQITVIIRRGVRQGLTLQRTEQEYNLFYSLVEMITTHRQYWICYYCLFFTSLRMANHEQCASSSSLIGQSKACPNPGRASSISSAKCTKPRSSLAKTDQSVFTAGNKKNSFLQGDYLSRIGLDSKTNKFFLIVMTPRAHCC